MPYPKLMVMVSFCWKMNFLPSKIKNIRFIDDVLEINDQSRCILSGPPCISEWTHITFSHLDSKFDRLTLFILSVMCNECISFLSIH